MYNGVLVACMAVMFMFMYGCTEDELQSERTKLELASVKQDLDQMFISLHKMVDLGDGSAKLMLSRIGKALKHREEMLSALSDHDHELALLAADKLIALSPGNKDAVRTIRESGQIFWLLGRAQKSLELFSGIQEVRKDAKTHKQLSGNKPWTQDEAKVMSIQGYLRRLGKRIDDADGVMGQSTKDALAAARVDYKGGALSDELLTKLEKKVAEKQTILEDMELNERRFLALSHAREYALKAKTLDPQFKGSLQLEELLDKAHATAVIYEAWKIYLLGNISIFSAAQLHETAVNGLNSAVKLSGHSVSDYWSRIAPIMRNAHNDLIDGHFLQVRASAKNISTYKWGTASSVAGEAQNFALMCEKGVQRLMEPTGSLLDFRRAGVEVMDEFKSQDLKYKAALPSKVEVADLIRAIEVVTNFNLYNGTNVQTVVDRNKDSFADNNI